MVYWDIQELSKSTSHLSFLSDLLSHGEGKISADNVGCRKLDV